MHSSMNIYTHTAEVTQILTHYSQQISIPLTAKVSHLKLVSLPSSPDQFAQSIKDSNKTLQT